jgi:hypothetical protein
MKASYMKTSQLLVCIQGIGTSITEIIAGDIIEVQLPSAATNPTQEAGWYHTLYLGRDNLLNCIPFQRENTVALLL